MKYYEYTFLNNKENNKNALHSLIYKIKEKYKDFIDFKIKQEGNFIILNSNFDFNDEEFLLTYKSFNNDILNSNLKLLKKEEKIVEVENFDQFKIVGNVCYKLNVLDLFKKLNISLNEKQEKILRNLNLLNNSGKIRKKIFYKDDGELLKLNLSEEEILKFCKDQLNKDCEKYGFKIDFENSFTNFDKCLPIEKQIKLNQNNDFKIFNLINMKCFVNVIDKDRFIKLYYKSIFNKGSFGVGFLNIFKN